MNRCNSVERVDDYSFDSSHSAFEQPTGLSGCSDDDILEMFRPELENTFAGITLTDVVKAELFVDYLYGTKGYFKLKSHAKAGKFEVKGVDPRKALASGRKAGELFNNSVGLLGDTLLAYGIPEEDHEFHTGRVVADIQDVHSNKKNEKYHINEMRRLKKIRSAMVDYAVGGMAAD